MKNIYKSKKNHLEIFWGNTEIRNICELLTNTSHLKILFLFLFACFGIHKLFYSYLYKSWLRESIAIPIRGKKLLFADHCWESTLKNEKWNWPVFAKFIDQSLFSKVTIFCKLLRLQIFWRINLSSKAEIIKTHWGHLTLAAYLMPLI